MEQNTPVSNSQDNNTNETPILSSSTRLISKIITFRWQKDGGTDGAVALFRDKVSFVSAQDPTKNIDINLSDIKSVEQDNSLDIIITKNDNSKIIFRMGNPFNLNMSLLSGGIAGVGMRDDLMNSGNNLSEWIPALSELGISTKNSQFNTVSGNAKFVLKGFVYIFLAFFILILLGYVVRISTGDTDVTSSIVPAFIFSTLIFISVIILRKLKSK